MASSGRSLGQQISRLRKSKTPEFTTTSTARTASLAIKESYEPIVFEKLDCGCSLDVTPWTAKRLYTCAVMKNSFVAIALTLTIGGLVFMVEAASQPAPSRAAGRLTIEQLIDIRHPSNPVWSPDGRRVAFLSERAGIANIRAQQGTTEDYLAKLEHAPDFILLDPPRSGIGKAVVKRLLELKPRAITIVACDPATLARDLSGLGYRIEKMTMVDLFPQELTLIQTTEGGGTPSLTPAATAPATTTPVK